MQQYSPEHLAGVWGRIRNHAVTGRARETAVGVDGVRGAVFERNLSNNLAEISRTVLRDGDDGLPCYMFAPLLSHEKLKTNGGVRNIHIARMRDQIVLRAMHEDIVGSAAPKGLDLTTAPPSKAVAAFRSALDPNCIVVRGDVAEFFDSVPRAKVVERALGLPLGPLTCGLLRKWTERVVVRPAWVAGKESDKSVQGLPQGLSLSASLAELWASQIDEEARRARLAYFRYVDDISIVCHSFREAEDALDWLVAATRRVDLRLSPSKTGISRITEGVSWLGLTHYSDKVVASPDRPHRWLKRFAALRRDAAMAIANHSADKTEILAAFHRAVRDEITGRTSSRPAWYAVVSDEGEWRRMDRSLHAFIRSLHRQAGAPPPTGRQLPSLHRAIASRRTRLSAPSNADKGPCATHHRKVEKNADQGHKAPDGAELSN